MVNTECSDQRYDRSMSENPPGGRPHGQSASGFSGAPMSAGYNPTSAGSPPWPPAPSQPARWPTFAALAIALVATGLAIVGWFRPAAPKAPSHATDPTYTEEQIAQAKTNACNAFQTVKKGTTLQTNLPQTDDPAMANAQATHAQLALVSGGWYLIQELDPATPPRIATELRKLAKTLSDFGANAIAGAKNADAPQAARMEDANSSFERITDMCK